VKEVLSNRRLNRATLARQLLLKRRAIPAADAIAHLVGMQAQVPSSPYVGLWSRLARFRPEELSDLIAGRDAVRIAAMRSTLHLVTAVDCLPLRAFSQPALDRDLARNVWGRSLAGVDLEQVAEVGRALVEERPMTTAEVGAILAERWPDRDPIALGNAVRNLVPLVQVPPRGLWGASGAPRVTTATSWLRRRPRRPDAGAIVLRFLGAFGPASVADLQTWSGVPGLREVVDRLLPRLRAFRDERGRELFDLPDAPRPREDVAAPTRFLPDYDNVLLSHDDRTRVISDEHRRAGGIGVPTVLVDGWVAARWSLERDDGRATIAVRPFRRLTAIERSEIEVEGERLLRVLEPARDRRAVRVDRSRASG
jgi:hypothetical protein